MAWTFRFHFIFPVVADVIVVNVRVYSPPLVIVVGNLIEINLWMGDRRGVSILRAKTNERFGLWRVNAIGEGGESVCVGGGCCCCCRLSSPTIIYCRTFAVCVYNTNWWQCNDFVMSVAWTGRPFFPGPQIVVPNSNSLFHPLRTREFRIFLFRHFFFCVRVWVCFASFASIRFILDAYLTISKHLLPYRLFSVGDCCCRRLRRRRRRYYWMDAQNIPKIAWVNFLCSSLWPCALVRPLIQDNFSSSSFFLTLSCCRASKRFSFLCLALAHAHFAEGLLAFFSSLVSFFLSFFVSSSTFVVSVV